MKAITNKKITLQFCSIFLILLIIPLVLAQTINSTDKEIEAGVTPDSAFVWAIDKALENIDLALTFDKSTSTKKRLRHAQERLLEIKAMVNEGKIDDAEKAEKKHEKILTEIKADLLSLGEEDEDDLTNVVEIENSILDQETEIENIRLRIKIKIEGQLTEEQIEQLLSFIASLQGNVDKIKIEIENKGERNIRKIKIKTGESEDEIENRFGRLREKRKVKAKIFSNNSLVRIEHRYTVMGGNKSDIVNEIIDRFALTEEEADLLLKIEYEDEEDDDHDILEEIEEDDNNNSNSNQISLTANAILDANSTTNQTGNNETNQTDNGSNGNNSRERLRVRVHIKEKHGTLFAEVKVRLEFIDGITRESIIEEIVSRTQLTEEEILEAIEFKEKHRKRTERKIEIEIKENKGYSKVEVKWLGKKLEFKLRKTNQEEILEEIALRLGISVDDIRPFVKFDGDGASSDGDDDEDDEDGEDEDNGDEDSDDNDNNSGPGNGNSTNNDTIVNGNNNTNNNTV